MTKKHFIVMAKIVRNILEGNWTNNPPSWASNVLQQMEQTEEDNRLRAVQTAEAFIFLSRNENPRFDQNRFLVACGLAEKPVKAR